MIVRYNKFETQKKLLCIINNNIMNYNDRNCKIGSFNIIFGKLKFPSDKM